MNEFKIKTDEELKALSQEELAKYYNEYLAAKNAEVVELAKDSKANKEKIEELVKSISDLKDNALISHYFKTAFNLKWRYDSPCNVPPCNVSKVLFEIICFLFSPIYQSVAFEHKLRRLRRLEEADRGQSTTKRTW